MFMAFLKRSCCGLVALVLTATALPAQQTTTTTQAPEPAPFPAPRDYGFGGSGGRGYGGMGGFGWGGMGGIGSTAAGSYLGGLSMAIRSQGQYNLMTSEAAINWQEADKRRMENQVNWTNTYFEKRRINQAYKQSQQGPRPSHSDWVRLCKKQCPSAWKATRWTPLPDKSSGLWP